MHKMSEILLEYCIDPLNILFIILFFFWKKIQHYLFITIQKLPLYSKYTQLILESLTIGCFILYNILDNHHLFYSILW